MIRNPPLLVLVAVFAATQSIFTGAFSFSSSSGLFQRPFSLVSPSTSGKFDVYADPDVDHSLTKCFMATTQAEEDSSTSSTEGKPELEMTKNGIYDLKSKEDHLAFLAANPDKITIIKFFAPWCRACKGLEPRYIQVKKDKKYDGLPLVFAQMTVQNNKDYIKNLGILALPSMHIYAGSEGLVENFPCGPSKVPILKKKIAQIVNQKVDAKTYQLKPTVDATSESEPCTERPITGTAEKTKLSVGDVVVKDEMMNYLRTEIPFFKDLTDREFNVLMAKSKYVTFEPGSVIMKQGKPGKTFYIIDSGEVEISVKAAFEDPLTTPSGYLGTAINRLGKRNYFGERSLITGQPRAASIKAVEKTRCFSFKVEDIPESSVLSGKSRATSERLTQINDKYGVDVYDINLISSQFESANVLNQNRGSINNPRKIQGVDTDDDVDTASTIDANESFNDTILTVLVRFKLIRHAARCFEYIKQSNPVWGDEGEAYRRSLLVSKLSPAQREEFMEVFKMIDISGDGKISLFELKTVLDTIEEPKTNEELLEIINKADPSVNGNTEISLNEFMGVMAEAEFYYMFKETFASLDKDNSGYIQAGKIDKVLCGLRDLISDDRKSIIDVEDKDMLVDYETFSRMMIGTHR